MQSFTAQVTAIRDLTHDVRQIDLTLRDPPDMEFVAGQFIWDGIDYLGESPAWPER